MQNILITGTGGFIGKNLKEFLSGNYNIFAPRSFELQLTDFGALSEYFEKNKIDFVIHCANQGGARGVSDAQTVVDDNLKMFNNLKVLSEGKRMITFGSGAQYNKLRDLKKIKEKNLGEVVPEDLYGKSKYLIAKEVEKSKSILCLNIFGSYGRWEKENRFPTDCILRNLRKEPIIINQNVVFDYIYIEDLCKIIEYFINNQPKERIINLTPTRSISLVEIAQIVNEISDFKSEIIVQNDKMNFEYTGDNSILLNELDGFKFTSYKKGLKKLYEFLEETV